MNATNAAQFLPLVQALAEGKTIQCDYGSEGWKDTKCPQFDGADRFRIKPEPRKFEGTVQSTMRSNGDLECITIKLDGYNCDAPKTGTKFRLIEII